jgi:hypothetical protein
LHDCPYCAPDERCALHVTETPTTEAPIMLRADITRDELRALKMLALEQNKTTQALIAEILRERIAA